MSAFLHPRDAFDAIVRLPDFGPHAETAMAVCIIRDQDPYHYVNTPFGQTVRWRAVILEAHLMLALVQGRVEPQSTSLRARAAAE